MQALSHPVIAVELSDGAKRWLDMSSPASLVKHSITDRAFSPFDFEDVLEQAQGFDEAFFMQIGKRLWRRRFPALHLSLPNAFVHSFDRKHLALALYIRDSIEKDYPVSCHLYADETPPPWSEFRLFIRDRKLVGASQYRAQEAFPEVAELSEKIGAALMRFGSLLIAGLHLNDAVADVQIEDQGGEAIGTVLIDLYPFDSRTDPCLFNWRDGGDFDGSFRFRKDVHNPYRGETHRVLHRSDLGLFREAEYLP